MSTIQAALNVNFAKMLERYRAVHGIGKKKIEARK
jgi:hypothetical protein